MTEHDYRSTPQSADASQEALETRLAELWARGPDTNATIEEAFGPFEDWMLSLGERALLLHPAAKAWLYLDPIHDTWESTGFGPGEVAFFTSGSRLGYRQRTPAALTCPHCGGKTPVGSRFCKRCGTRLAPEPTHCTNCGFDNVPGSSFCNQCGTPLRRLTETLP